ncbi:transcriptional regulator [Corynebacterium sp. HMSC08F01]|uniref:DNA-binding protein n=1 Tax=Corynebacterium coyleae TaxID=53374 RepID=A0AAP7CBX2_9CORY|nr:DNA-binding protein [Corynebacterium coyleae]OFT29204.1 transcriptional regulator [Corynebacterium sp. HMSC08F01]
MYPRVESCAVSTQTNLEQLLSDETLLAFPDAAEALGVPVTRVHDYVGARKLVMYIRDGKKFIPAGLIGEDGLSKFVSGAITVLADGGYNDEEILTFLYTAEDSLPGRPIDALHGQKAREVIRRAQAMAF